MFEKIQRFVKAVFKQEYARASIYYVAANIIGQGIVLLSSAVFTRLMSKEDYGLVSTYSTWVLILNTFICLNLFITVRNAYIDFKKDYDRFVSSVLLLNILSGALISVIIVIASKVSRMDFGFAEVILACMQSVALNVINYKLAVQAMKNEYKQRTFMMIAPNWTHILLSIALMVMFPSIAYMAKIAGNAFGLLIFGVVCTILVFHKAKPEIVLEYWKYALVISVPSIFYTLSDLVLMQCDRLMLTDMVNAEETAEYSIIYNISSIIVAIYQAIGGAWTPWFFARVVEKNDEAVKEYQGAYILGFAVFSAGMMAISPELVKIMAPRDYWNGIRYVAPIVCASYLIFLSAFFSGYLMYRKKTGRIAINTIVAATLNLIVNALMIPKYQSAGAVMATVISYYVLFFLHYLAIGKDGKKYFVVGQMGFSILCIVVYGVIFYYIRDYWYLRYGVLIIVIFVVYLWKGRQIIEKFVKAKQ